jgi:GxxExxY protein
VGLVEHPTNQISERVIGAAIEVHRQLGPGLLESSYHTCFCRELDLRGVSYTTEIPLPIEYKGVRLAKGYVIDFLIEEAVIVEVKSVRKLAPYPFVTVDDLHAPAGTVFRSFDQLQR